MLLKLFLTPNNKGQKQVETIASRTAYAAFVCRFGLDTPHHVT